MKTKSQTFVAAILAGLAISIGATVNLACDNRYMGAFLFSVGLFCVCSFRWDLFTGKVPYARTREEWVRLPLIWVGNILGAFIGGTVIAMSKLSTGTFDGVFRLVTGKLNTNPIELFFSAICCNVLIYIAVEGYKTIGDVVGKYLSIIFCVMVFILCGFDHCIADAAYAAMAGCSILYATPLILTATIGNAAGGLLIAAT